jgi:hypothetical protein
MNLSVENLDCMLGLHGGTISRTLTTKEKTETKEATEY